MSEEDLRTILNTQWLSKVLENIIGDFILPRSGPVWGTEEDIHIPLSGKVTGLCPPNTGQDHTAVLCGGDLSKAYNRGSH